MASIRAASKQHKTSLTRLCRHYSAPADGSIPPSKQRFVPDSGTYPKGFLVGSAHARVKPSNTSRDDVAIIASENLCVAAGWFTKNSFKAAPVKENQATFYSTGGVGIRGVVVNSGCANAVTGTQGREDAQAMARAVDQEFAEETRVEKSTKVFPDRKETIGGDSNTLVMSTGVIGQKLPMDRILPVIPTIKKSLGNTHDHWMGVAKAIMTTDTFPKLISRTFTLPSHPDTTYTISGMSKGAGMIHPNLGTLLSIICTDCPVTPGMLRYVGNFATNRSFNNISIDGDTSTNDSVVILANGAAAPADSAPINDARSPDGKAFAEALVPLMSELAQLVVRDGEGATKFISIRVGGAADSGQAHAVAESIARSPLVKTAMYGRDANWGRILCAIGNVAGGVKPKRTSVWLASSVEDGWSPKVEVYEGENIGSGGGKTLSLVERGQPCVFTDEDAKPFLDQEDINICVNLHDTLEYEREEGKVENHSGKCLYHTCDFSHEYVTINADYRT